MNVVETRQTIDFYLNQLSLERLNVIADILTYLAKKESEEATQELLDIPEFIDSFERGKRDIAQGRMVAVEQLKRKY